jgi:hypothetical protein
MVNPGYSFALAPEWHDNGCIIPYEHENEAMEREKAGLIFDMPGGHAEVYRFSARIH